MGACWERVGSVLHLPPWLLSCTAWTFFVTRQCLCFKPRVGEADVARKSSKKRLLLLVCVQAARTPLCWRT